ncbi:hypothetical protein DPX39_080035800 [Trypanosoma brucei equiperdum]|uniref:Transmembrane protein n=2 Tax=Trypanosoma brucei TaxID=5691 RepID=A0A3L6L2L2_9TRYP|nr:hypothetical protein DPX39_080035800 [Trypanosoma brucei equiperdum]
MLPTRHINFAFISPLLGVLYLYTTNISIRIGQYSTGRTLRASQCFGYTRYSSVTQKKKRSLGSLEVMWRFGASSTGLKAGSPLVGSASRRCGSTATPSRRRSGFFKMGDMYKPGRYTSKDLPKGPSGSNQPWDPVYANYAFQLVTGPLKRKQNTTPDDHLTVDELDKWMDAKGAAKVLGIKEEELPTLTAPAVEEYWAKAYGQRNNAHQQETVIAAEVLLEYIDSTVHRKKSRQYYRRYMDNARQAIDHETEMRRSEHRQKFIHLFGVAMFTGSAIVVIIAFFRGYFTRQDVEKIGTDAAAYLNMVFSQPPNLEPPPDYSTRYRDTPPAMELAKQQGVYGVVDPARLSNLSKDVKQYRADEEMEMLRMLNDENEKARQRRKEDQVRESRVVVYRAGDFDDAGELKDLAKEKEAVKPLSAFSQQSFRDFAALMASQFGGGSRFQRITQDSVRRAEEMERMQKRMNEIEE